MLHDESANWDVEGQGAGMLSFKSQTKLTSDDLSNTTSDGKLGKRHPESIFKTEDKGKWDRENQTLKKMRNKVLEENKILILYFKSSDYVS